MLYEFQVLFTAGAELREQVVRAETEAEAEQRVRELVPEAQKVNVGTGRPLVDWNQPWFTTEEAAVRLRCSTSQISSLMATGELPKPRNGNPRFPARVLDACQCKRMGLEEAA
jgi:hypothetical protein